MQLAIMAELEIESTGLYKIMIEVISERPMPPVRDL